MAIVEASGIEPLVALSGDGTDGQKALAADALRNLAFENDDHQVAIAQAGGIAPLVALARDGTDEQKTTAAGALRNLAANADNQLAISQAGGIGPLLALARDGTDEQKALAAGALDAYEGRLLNKDGTPAWPWEDADASDSKADL